MKNIVIRNSSIKTFVVMFISMLIFVIFCIMLNDSFEPNRGALVNAIVATIIGAGLFSAYIADALENAGCLELTDEGINLERKLLGMEFFYGDIDEIRMRNIFIGYVRFVFVLKDGVHHEFSMVIDNPKKYVENIQEVCEQKGIVFVSEKGRYIFGKW